MATRGTVMFRTGENEGGKILGFIYIHHDMYPQGFAEYLKEVLQNDKVRGNNFMARFVRGIERADIIPSHESHGDTDYRYNIVGGFEDGYISVVERQWNDEDEECEYKLRKIMKLKDFILNPDMALVKSEQPLPYQLSEN